MSWYGTWKPYVPVAKRRARAAAYAKKLAKSQKRSLAPIDLTGRKITTTFWGQAWCDNLECYSDFANRLPRGRTYVRNGSIIDLQINRGKVEAIVSGSEIYRVEISIRTLMKPAWNRIKRDCSQSVASLIDLLQGRFDQGIMRRLTQAKGGLFPEPAEIEMSCTCPDWAHLCKHVAATLYGVGARLDVSPELLFVLRAVDHLELVSEAADADSLTGALAASTATALGDQDLGELFGIELDGASPPKSAKAGKRRKTTSPARPKATANSRARHRIDEKPAKLPLKSTRKAVGHTKSKVKPAAKTKAGKTAAAKQRSRKKA